MAINSEIDAALESEMRKMATAPRDSTFLVVLNTERQNDYLQFCLGLRTPMTDGMTMIERKYRGCVIAVSHDAEMPRVSVFTKAKV